MCHNLAKGVLAVVAVGLLLTSTAQAVVVDNFSGFLPVSVPALGVNPSIVSAGALSGGAIGGARAIILTRVSGNGEITAYSDLGGDGLFSLGSGPDDVANATIQYDGDTNSTLNPTGLGAQNLTLGGHDSIRLGYRADLAGASIDVTVFTDATHASHDSFNTTATGFGGAGFIFVDLPYSSFTTAPTFSAPASFTSVGAIQITLNATGVSALDLQLGTIQSAVLPEPASIGLIGIGLALLARRRK